MGGFSLHPLLPGLKVRVTAVHHHGDRLYLGTATGSVQVYSYATARNATSGVLPKLELLKTYVLSRRAIDQLGVLPESNQLAVLSDSTVSLYSLPDIAPNKARVLSQARNAHTLTVTSFDPSAAKGKRSVSIEPPLPGARGTEAKEQWDLLVIGCRKKVVVFGGGINGLKDAWELALPHSPRHIILASPTRSSPLPETAHLLYSPQSSVILHLNPTSTPHLSVTELPISPPPPVSGASAPPGASGTATAAAAGEGGGGISMGMGVSALSGLGGYVGLGGKAAVPIGTRTVGGEVLLARDDLGVFISSEGNYTRHLSLQWPGPPDALAFSNPYIFSIVSIAPIGPGGTPTSAVQIHLAPTLALREILPIPAPSNGTLAVSPLTLVSTGSTSPAGAKSSAIKMMFVSTPTDKALGASEGSTIWGLEAGEVGEQVDELVREGRVKDAIGLVESVGEAGLSPMRRLPHLKTLLAVTQFAQGQYQSAMDSFLIFNINPALVISLYPAETISGALHVPRDMWMELFGAVEGAKLESEAGSHTSGEQGPKGLLKSVAHLGLGGGMDSLKATAGKEDAVPISETPTPALISDENVAPRAALEALMYFLSDRRQKLTGAISSLPTPLPAESTLPPLSALPPKQLHNLPNVPMAELDSEQLLRMAQVIYTALLKVYLVARPVLVGSLCRIENWCDVEEVEGLLKAQMKVGDLIDLYQGKKMHAKALKMLHELAKMEADRLDRYPPTVRYLEKLGPSEINLIFESSKWIFNEEPKMGLQIFTADEAEVEALPRDEVMHFLEKMNPDACVGYLEHVIDTLGEEGADFHDKLAELYLERARKAHASEEHAYKQFLGLLTTSTHYRPYRLLTRLLGEDMPEARAILLGRIGKHEEALRIYIYRLQDYPSAESYCAKVYSTSPDPNGIFLLLLKLYLRPTASDPVLLSPALNLIAKHSTRLDANQVLDLLPPLVTMEEVKSFFVRTLRDGYAKRNEARVIRSLVASRKEEVERCLMGLQTKRVRVTDQRICPQCHKRLGQSAIAVHAPRGEVTHLHCKDPFNARLAQIRG